MFKYVKRGKVLTIKPIYKINQDTIEILFYCIRSPGRFNNNLNDKQFEFAYKMLNISNKNTVKLHHYITSNNHNIISTGTIINKSSNFKFTTTLHNLVDHDYFLNANPLLAELPRDVIIHI